MKCVKRRQSTAVCFLLPFTLLMVQCGRTRIHEKTVVHVVPNTGDATADDSSDDASDDKDDPTLSLVDMLSAYGIRSVDQINETMSVLTGVPPTTAAVATVFAEVKSQLPSNNDIKSFIGSHQVGVSKLAVEYCDAMINNATLRAAAVPNFAFASPPSTALNAQGVDNLIAGLVNSFWGKDLEALPDSGESNSELESLFGLLIAGESQSDAAVTLKVAKGMCSAVLSAAPVTIF